MKIGANGWVSGLRRIASPNQDARPRGTAINMLVIHNLSLAPGEFGGDGITPLFTKTLNAAAHPYYAQL